MSEFFANLFSTNGFVARRTCGEWSDGHVWLHTASDLLIWLAYLSIPLVLTTFLWKRRGQLPFRGLIALFAAFILACGFTHLLDALMFVWPAYRLSGVVKAVTAVVSWLTVAALITAVPRVLAFVDNIQPSAGAWAGLTATDPGRPQRYVVAAGLAGIALLLRFAGDPVLGDGRGFVLPLLAVIAAAWYGGFWPGLLALALGGGGFALLFVGVSLGAENALSPQADMALFVFCGVAAAALGQAQRSARVAADVAVADLNESNRHLARSQWDTTEALTQLDAFLTHAPVGLAFLDPELRFLRVNKYLADANGRPEADHKGKTIAEVLPDFPADVLADYQKVLDSGTPLRDRVVAGLAGPDSAWHVNAYPARDPYGVVVGLAVVAQDVTDRVRQERAVQASEARFRTLTEAVPGFIWSATPDGQLDYHSRRVQEYSGRPAADLLGAGWADIVHPDDRPRAGERWAAALATGEPYQTEFRLRRADGAYRWHAVQALAQRAGPTVEKWVGYCADVHEQKAAAEALAASQARFRATADAAPAVLWETDPDGQCVFLSRGWYDLTGQGDGEGLGLGWLAMTHPDDAAPAGEAFHRANTTRGTFRVDYRVRRADGGYRWATDIGRPRFGPAGEYLGMVGSVIDIDERKRAEEAVRASEERYRTLFETMDQGYCVIEMLDGPASEPDHDWRFLETNPAFGRQNGLTDAAGRTIRELAPDIEPHWFERYGRVARTGEPVRFVEHSPALGRWFEVYAARQGGPGSRKVAVLFSDITTRKQAEDDLQRANDELERRVAERTAEVRREKAFLEGVLESIEDAIVACDADGVLTLFNRSTKQLHGLPPEPLPADRWADHYNLYGPDGHTPMTRDEVPLFRALAGEPVRNVEMVVAAHGAEPRTLLASGRALFDEDGRRLGAVVSMHDITDRRRAEAARTELVREQTLRQAETRFRDLADAMPQIVYVTRPGGTAEYLNLRWYEYTGQPDGSLDDTSQPVHPDDRDRLAVEYARAVAAGEEYAGEFRLRRADGAYRWFLTRSVPVRDAEGVVVNWYGTSTDIDDQKRAEEALRAGERRLRMALSAARMVAWEYDPGTGQVVLSENAAEVFALPPGGTVTDDVQGFGLLHPDDVAAHRAKVGAAVAGRGSYLSLYRQVRPDSGAVIWLEERGHAVGDGPVRLAGVVADVTDRVRAEAAARAAEERFAFVRRSSGVGFWYCDLPFDVLEWDERVKAHFHLPPDARVTIDTFYARIHPDDREPTRRAIERSIADRTEYDTVYRTVAADTGAVKWLRAVGRTSYGPDGAPTQFDGVTVDVTDTRRAEEALRASEADLRDAQRVAQVGSWRWDVTTDQVTGSDELCRIYGLDPAGGVPAYAEQDGTLYPHDSWLQVGAAIHHTADTGESVEVDVPALRGGAEPIWVSVRTEAERDAAGRVATLRGTVADITHRKRTEQALRESQDRLELAVAIAKMGMFEIDLATDAVVVNEPGRAIYGWDSGRTTFARVQDHFHPDDKAEVVRQVEAAFDPAGPGTFEVEQRIHRTDGAVRWIRVRGQAFFDGDGADRRAVRCVGTYLDVTNRVTAEQTLKESEANARLALGVARLGTWRIDPDSFQMEADARTREVAGLPPTGDVAVADFVPRIHPDDWPRIEADLQVALSPTGTGEFAAEYRYVHLDGAVRWATVRGQTEFVAGRPVVLRGTLLDITERKLNEQALVASESRFRGLADTAPMAIYEADPAGRITFMSRYWTDFTGTPADDALGEGWGPLVRPDHLDRLAANWYGAMAGAARFDDLFPLKHKSGRFRWVQSRAVLTRQPDGRPQRWVGVLLDIHDRVEAEEALAATQRTLTMSLSVANAGVYAWDVAADRWTIRTADPNNPGALATSRPVTSAKWLAAVHPDDRDRVRAEIAAARDTRKPYTVQLRVGDRDQGWRWVENRGQFEYAPDGTASRLIGVRLDVHDRKAAEEAARKADLEFRAMADSIPQLAWMTRPDGHIDWYNSRWYEYTGTTFEQMQGWGWETVHDPAELRRMLPGWKAALAAGTHWEDTFPLRGADGAFRWFLSRARPIRDDAGAVVRWFGTNTDVTAQRQLEADLRAAGDRFRFLDALGQATRDTDSRATLAVSTRMLGGHLRATRCAYADMHPDGDRFTIPHDWTDGADSTVGDYSLALFGPTAVADLNARRPLVVRDVDAELGPAGGADMFNAIGIKAIVCCPLVKGGRLVALMAVHQATPRDWTPAEIGLVTEVVERSWAHIERARAESEAEQAGERFQVLAESVPALVWSGDAVGHADYHSSRWAEYTGRPVADMGDGGWSEAVHPDDRTPAAEAEWGAALAAGRPYRAEYRLRRHDGAYRWHLSQARPHRDAGGAVVRWYGAVTDIDDQKRLEADLRASGERFRTLTEAIPQLVWNADADGRVNYVNTRWREYTGLDEAETGTGWWDRAAHPADAAGVAESWAKVMTHRRPEPVRSELRLRRASDGAYRWFLMGVVPLRRPDGSVDQWIGSLSDVHDLKVAEEATRASEARFRNLVEAVPNLVWVTDADGHVTQLNRQWVTYSGRQLDDLLGDGWTTLLHPDDVAGAMSGWQAAVRHRAAYTGEFRFRTAAGDYRWQLARGIPVPGPDGRLSQWFGTTTDIDGQKRAADLLETQVRERTAELHRSNGELEKFAYVASHDLQEPLRKVQAFGDRLATKFAPGLGPDGKDYIERMQASAARMQTLIDDLLTFARVASKPKAFAPVALGPLVAGVLSDLEALTTRTGAVVSVGELPTILGEAGQWRQLVQNLIANACKFARPGRPPGVAVAAVRLETLSAAAEPPPGFPAGWRLTVSDDGIGFEQQYAERIFEVFQRLHGRGQYEGTGIGLAICRKIVERHGGIITARGRPGEGAVFAVDLPAPPGDPTQ